MSIASYTAYWTKSSARIQQQYLKASCHSFLKYKFPCKTGQHVVEIRIAMVMTKILTTFAEQIKSMMSSVFALVNVRYRGKVGSTAFMALD